MLQKLGNGLFLLRRLAGRFDGYVKRGRNYREGNHRQFDPRSNGENFVPT